MSSLLGINSKLYRNSGNFASPTWVEVDHIANLAIDATWDEAEGSIRSSTVKRKARTQMDLQVTGDIRVSTVDAGYQAFRDAHANINAVLDLMILNGSNTTNGVHGWRAEWEVFGFGEDQSLSNKLFANFTLMTSCKGTPVQQVIVASSNHAFTNI